MNEKTKIALMLGGGLGIVMVICGVIPIVGCCNCVLPIAGGAVGVMMYVKKAPNQVSIGEGAGLGALLGVVAAAINLIIGLPISLLIGGAAIAAQMEQLRRQGIDIPPALAGMTLIVVGAVIAFVVTTVLGTLGGVIGVPIFEKRKAGGAPPPPQQYGGGFGS